MLSNGLLRQMVDAIPTPVFVMDSDERYVYVNRAFELLFQVRAEHVVGKSPVTSDDGSVKVLRPSVPSCPRSLAQTTAFTLPDGRQMVMGLVQVASGAENQELQRMRGELAATRLELARLRETDPVTQCLSRRALQAHTEAVLGSERAGVIRIRLDELATVHEHYGDDVADRLLTTFSDMVRASTRPGDLFARVSDNEFTLVLRGVDREQTASAARRICSTVSDTLVDAGGESVGLSVAVGAAFSDDDDAELSAIVDQAGDALRSASRNEAVVV